MPALVARHRPSASPRALVAGALLALVLGVAPPAVASPVVVGSTTAVSSGQLMDGAVALVNQERAKAGCAPLRVQPALAKAARLHSLDMGRYDYFSHVSRDGRTPWDRIQARGYQYGSAENLAAGQTSARAVVAAWMNSPGHRANILDCSNVDVGIGVAQVPTSVGRYGIYWTQDFGRR